MKTKTDSYKINNLCRGCKLCLKGQKLVLFVGGKCSRNCWYCSLSEGRKNSTQMWANERPCETNQDIIQEVIDSNATGAGITGGDPLVYLDKTISAAKALKIKFGKKFHIHIYLPLPLVEKSKLEKLHEYIDEVRFHPSFLTNPDESLMQEEIEKIKLASQIFGKQNTGIELPLLPEKKKEIIEFIKQVEPYISFVNLNEFELSDTNFETITKDYTLNEDTYTIHGSIETGKGILKHFQKSSHRQEPISQRSDLTGKSRSHSEEISFHLCTAKTKNHHQYHNRLLLHNILQYGIRTEDATVVYFTIIPKNMKETIQELKQYTKHFHIDSRHNRILLKESEVKKLYNTKKFEINLCEEHPTFDAEKMSFWKITEEDFN